MRLTLVISSLACGGAERVAQMLAAGFRDSGHAVTLITTTIRGDFFTQPKDVDRVRLDLVGKSPGAGLRAHLGPAGLVRGCRSLRTLRRAVARSAPDVVISMMDQVNVVVLLSLVGDRYPVIVTEHSDPAHRPLAWPWKAMRSLTYRRAAALVSVSAGVDRRFEALPASRRAVIGNPVSTEVPLSRREDLPQPLRHVRFVAAMGRLTVAKGFDRLIRSFGRLSKDRDPWQLAILGDGEESDRLRTLTEGLGLQGRVHFLGAVKDPHRILQHAEIFALTSRWEGFGNAIVEAMACGVPVVSFDCPSGPAEIIDHGQNGILVPPGDTVAFTAALESLMANPGKRGEMGREAKMRARDFSLEKTVRRWEGVLAEVVREVR